jgi:hypothetical protein
MSELLSNQKSYWNHKQEETHDCDRAHSLNSRRGLDQA